MHELTSQQMKRRKRKADKKRTHEQQATERHVCSDSKEAFGRSVNARRTFKTRCNPKLIYEGFNEKLAMVTNNQLEETVLRFLLILRTFEHQ